MPDYSKSKIYLIKNKNNDNLIYVGSTTEHYLSTRFNKHKAQQGCSLHQRTGGVHCRALRALRALLCTFLGPPMHGLRHKFSMSWNRIMQHSVRCMGA